MNTGRKGSAFFALLALVLFAFGCATRQPPRLAADNFEPGFDWTTATGLYTGADLEDTFSKGEFTESAFSPANTNRLFDSLIITCRQVHGSTWVATIASNSIKAQYIAEGAVQSNEIAQSAVVGWHIKDGSIMTADLSTNPFITSAMFGTNVVGSNAIVNFSIGVMDLSTNMFPAFRVYNGTTNAFGSITKVYTNGVRWLAEDFDTSDLFDLTTEVFRARSVVDSSNTNDIRTNHLGIGLWRFNATMGIGGLGDGNIFNIYLVKNGQAVAAREFRHWRQGFCAASIDALLMISSPTDRVAVYTFSDASAITALLSKTNTYFEGYMVSPWTP